MNEDLNLQHLWQGGQNWQTRLQPVKLVQEVKEEVSKLYGSIKTRNRSEIWTALLVIPLFFYIGYLQENPLAQWGAWSVCVYGLWVILIMSWMSRQRPVQQLGRPFREQLQAEIIYFQKEKRLLNSVVWWYILPLYLGLGLFHWGLNDSWWMFMIMMAITSWIMLFIIRLNKKAVRQQINPLLERLQRLKEELES